MTGRWVWDEVDDYGFVHSGKNTDGQTPFITGVEFKITC